MLNRRPRRAASLDVALVHRHRYVRKLYLADQPVEPGMERRTGVAEPVRGADQPAKIGLNETSIGMPLPLFAVELARDRLAPEALVRATLAAETFGPHGAAEIGYLDQVVAADECESAAVAEARRLGEYSNAAYAQTKQVLRQPVVERVLAGGAADLERFAVNG
jgi:enoyl-CoA hydratase/carnithine racemase